MLDLIEPLLAERKLDYVRLDGSVPQKESGSSLSTDFARIRAAVCSSRPTPARRVSIFRRRIPVINVDLPWNPAVLEQRVARAHRMGQRQPVQVYVLVTEGTIEESLLGTAFGQARSGAGRFGSRLERGPGGLQERRRGVAGGVWKCCWAPSPRRRWT